VSSEPILGTSVDEVPGSDYRSHMTTTDDINASWIATVTGMDEPPLTDDEFEALRTVLFDTGEGIPREAQLELMQTAIWQWKHSYRPRDPGQGALKSAGEIPPAAAAGFLRGAAEDPEIPERVRVMLGVVEDALERAGAMVAAVYATWAETEDASGEVAGVAGAGAGVELGGREGRYDRPRSRRDRARAQRWAGVEAEWGIC